MDQFFSGISIFHRRERLSGRPSHLTRMIVEHCEHTAADLKTYLDKNAPCFMNRKLETLEISVPLNPYRLVL
jgi:hypothetical protein